MEELTVEWLLPDGRGGGRDASGRVVRVADALPGDTIRWEAQRSSGRGVDARLVELVTPSPLRREPDCPHAATCGGCDLAALAPEVRVDLLRRSVAFALRGMGNSAAPPAGKRRKRRDAPGGHATPRRGQAPQPELPVWVPSPRASGHRARVKLAIDGGRVGYRASRSHDLVEIDTCAVARDEVREALVRLREQPLPEGLGSVEIRSDGTRAVYAFEALGGARVPPEALRHLGDVALDGRALAGSPVLDLEVEGVRLRASPRSFYQVNLEINALLVAHVRDLVVGLGAERVLDLYAGIGNLSLPMAATGVPVVAVELEGQAIADLRACAGSLPVEPVVSAVERFDPTRTPFDVAVLDPPRAGAPGVLARLVRQRPKGIVYVSCHLPSAIRDAREAVKSGYAITQVRCFDMFPDTHHFETVLLLERQ